MNLKLTSSDEVWFWVEIEANLDGGDDTDDDWLFGGPGNDFDNAKQSPADNEKSKTAGLFGGDDDHHLFGGSGRDDLDGGDDQDHLYGGIGDDVLRGQQEIDHIYGEGDDDELYGGSGGDVLEGGTGSDMIFGGPDGDMIIFGNQWGVLDALDDEDDKVDGGTGVDTVDMSRVTPNLDITIDVHGDAAAVSRVNVTTVPLARLNDGFATAEITNVETIKGGQGRNKYIVANTWRRKLTIEDPSDNYVGILDLSNVQSDLIIRVRNNHLIEIQRDVAPLAADDVISAHHIDTIKLGPQKNTFVFYDGGEISQTLVATAGHSVVLDYRQLNMAAEVGFKEGQDLSKYHDPNNTHGLSFLQVENDHNGAMPQSVWLVSAPSDASAFTVSVGNRDKGQHTTSSTSLTSLATALAGNNAVPGSNGLSNVSRALVVAPATVNGLRQSQVTLWGDGLSPPDLLSAKYAVSRLTNAVPGTAPAGAPANQQELSFFADDSSLRSSVPGSFVLTLNTGVTGMFNYGQLKGSTQGFLAVLTAEFANAGLTAANVFVSGTGVHHDPWIIQFTGGHWIRDVDATGLKSRGVVHLKRTTTGTATKPWEWLLGNNASEGEFKLTVDFNNNQFSEKFAYDAPAREIEEWLKEELIPTDAIHANYANPPNFLNIEVTGEGRGDPTMPATWSPWKIEILGKRNANNNGALPARPTLAIANVYTPSTLHGIAGGVDLGALTIVEIRASSHGDEIVVPHDEALGNTAPDMPSTIKGGNEEDTLVGGRSQMYTCISLGTLG